MTLGVLTEQFLHITPHEHQEAYQQGITQYGYVEIALVTQDIKRPPHLTVHVDGAFKLAHHLANRAATSYTNL
jgi:hypothetical protein